MNFRLYKYVRPMNLLVEVRKKVDYMTMLSKRIKQLILETI